MKQADQSSLGWIMRIFACLVALVMAVNHAKADPVIAWNEAVGEIVRSEHAAHRGGPHGTAPVFRSPNTARAQVALAIFEAVNAIDQQYESYLGISEVRSDASQRAAIATAAHSVLTELYPDQKPTLDAALAIDLAAVADGPEKDAGIAIGRDAAQRVLARPLQPDGAPVPSYRPYATPGVYVPTTLPVLPMSFYARTPWVLTAPDEFSPPPPPALTSDRYARDWDEVRRLGSRNSSERSTVQTVSATFWNTHDFAGAIRLLTSRPGRSYVENARFYALLALAIDDAGIAITVAKYDNAFWRPITSIRNADEDGNPETSVVPDWEPLLLTPMHPEYPCGHCIFAAVTAEIIAMEFGRKPYGGITFGNPSFPGAAWTVTTTDEYAQAVSDSRIFGGAHYRFSNEAAQGMGRDIARAARDRAFRQLAIAETPER